MTFSTNSYADITMFGDIAHDLLLKMGHSGTVPGAILAADVPLALSCLTSAIEAESLQPPAKESDTENVSVSLAARSLPLIN